MTTLTGRLGEVPADYFSRFRPPPEGGRASAVLMLFGPGDGDGDGDDVVLTERSSRMRSHPGQVSFPGGRLDPHDAGPASAAMREAREEVGLTDTGVKIVAELPELYLPVSDSAVTPVLAWWATPRPLRVRSPEEVERVIRVPVDDLVEPANRFTVSHPSGYRGPGFETPQVYVWGFTAGLLAKVLELAGLERDWDRSVHRPLPERFSPRLVTAGVTAGAPGGSGSATPSEHGRSIAVATSPTGSGNDESLPADSPLLRPAEGSR
ncbi:MAG TPA: CoA pyrophosphatase [Dermatophilaceae bacterium]|nr:CoA pyrophosphatase [Dermatophilaceae bacterium]